MRPGSVLVPLFPRRPVLVGMVHLLPLPGSPRWAGSMRSVVARAVADARILAESGFDAVMVENYQDAPFYPARVPPETVAGLSVAVGEVVRAVEVPVGVNVLRNDGPSAVAIAVATGARMVRVNVHTGAMLADQGWLSGEAHETLRLRARLGAEVAILADVLVKHATPPPGIDLEQAARDAWDRGLADGLVVSGLATGAATDLDRVGRVKAAVPDAPVWIGSGLTPELAASQLAAADGAIVGTTLMHGGTAGAGVDPARVAVLMQAVGRGKRLPG